MISQYHSTRLLGAALWFSFASRSFEFMQITSNITTCRTILLATVVFCCFWGTPQGALAQTNCGGGGSNQRLTNPSKGHLILPLRSGQRLMGGETDGKPLLILADADLGYRKQISLSIPGVEFDGSVVAATEDREGNFAVVTQHLAGGGIVSAVSKVSADLSRVIWSRALRVSSQNVLLSSLEHPTSGDYIVSGSTNGNPAGCDALLLTLDRTTGAVKATLNANAGSCEDWDQLRFVNGRLYGVGRWDPESTSTPGYRITLTKFTEDLRGVEWAKYYIADGRQAARSYSFEFKAQGDRIFVVGNSDPDGTSVEGVDAVIIETDLAGEAQRIDFLDFPDPNSREMATQIGFTSRGMMLGGVFTDRGVLKSWLALLDQQRSLVWARAITVASQDSRSDIDLKAFAKRFDMLETETRIFTSTSVGRVEYAAVASIDASGNTTSACTEVTAVAIKQRTISTPATYRSKVEVYATPRAFDVVATRLVALADPYAQTCPAAVVKNVRTSQTICEGDSLRLGDGQRMLRITSGTTVVCESCVTSVLAPTVSATYLLTSLPTAQCSRVDTVVVFVNPRSASTRDILSCTGAATLPDGRIVTESGAYTVEFTSVGGCDSTVTGSVAVGLNDTIPYTRRVCAGDSIRAFGNTYYAGGSYLQTVRAGNCERTLRIRLNELPSYRLDSTYLLCGTTSAVYGGTRYADGEVVTKTFTTRAGCDSLLSIRFVASEVVVSEATATLCEGDSLRFGPEILTTAGNYEFALARDGKCDSVSQLTLELLPTPREREVSMACFGETISYAGEIYTSNTTITVVATAANGCDSIHQQVLEFVALPVVEVASSKFACDTTATGAITLRITARGPTRTSWPDGGFGESRLDLRGGTYLVSVTDTLGCTTERPVSVESVRPVAVSAERQGVGCFGEALGMISLQPADSLRTAELDGTTAPGMTFENLAAGTYALTYEDTWGCLGSRDVTLDDGTGIPSITHRSPIRIVLGDSVQLAPVYDESFAVHYPALRWLSCDTCARPWASPLFDTMLVATVVDTAGCRASTTVALTVARGPELFVPTAFSPNGDRVNDRWRPEAATNVDRVLELLVFDRWGEMVFVQRNFSPHDPSIGWDGQYRGRDMDPAVYVYLASYQLKDGTQLVKKGDFVLLR